MQKTAIAVGLALFATVWAAAPAEARRRVIGAETDEEDEEEKEEPKLSPEEAEKKKEAAEKKAEKKRKKAAEKRRKKDEAERAAREAAEKAAEEAEAKAEAEAERKKQEAIEKEKSRLESNRAERLKKAKKLRRLWRNDGDMEFTFSLSPGAPVTGKVVELRLAVVKRLAVASAKYGELEPQKVKMIVEVTPPDSGEDEEAVAYRAHPMGSPGVYGIHFTPTVDGPHTVSVVGKARKGREFRTNVTVFVGEWPPPDLEQEEKTLKKALEKGAAKSGRRILDG